MSSAIVVETPARRYRIRSTGESSLKYGPCEVCGKHAAEVHLQARMDWAGEIDAWVYPAKLATRFGHVDCLTAERDQ